MKRSLFRKSLLTPFHPILLFFLAAFFGPTSLTLVVASPMPREHIYVHPAPAAERYFGPSSDISDKYVGVLGNQNVASRPSEFNAFIYDAATGNHIWTFTQPVFADNVNFRFESIAIDGDIAVVGATYAHVPINGGTAFNAGAAYVYDLATGLLRHKLVSNSPQNNSLLGSSVDILGDKIVVGSWGNAYVFDAITGHQLARLNPSEPTGQFGISVGISESAIVVGANSDTSLGQFTGAAFTFDPNTFAQVGKYVPSDAAQHDNFGIEVAVDGDYAIASSRYRAYVFDALTGVEIRSLTLPGNQNIYPHRVDIEGTTALLGNPVSKRAAIFDWSTGLQLRHFVPDSLANSPNYGESVALSGDQILVGAEGKIFQFSAIPEPTCLLLITCAFMDFLFKRP